MKTIMVEMLKQILAEKLYPAVTAELNCDLCICEKDIGVKVYGYNQKLPVSALSKIVLKLIEMF